MKDNPILDKIRNEIPWFTKDGEAVVTPEEFDSIKKQIERDYDEILESFIHSMINDVMDPNILYLTYKDKRIKLLKETDTEMSQIWDKFVTDQKSVSGFPDIVNNRRSVAEIDLDTNDLVKYVTNQKAKIDMESDPEKLDFGLFTLIDKYRNDPTFMEQYKSNSLGTKYISDCIGRAFLLPESDGDYPEDFPHENGAYCCKCKKCGIEFTGHKRRRICKICANEN
jgi:hypothetical protein